MDKKKKVILPYNKGVELSSQLVKGTVAFSKAVRCYVRRYFYVSVPMAYRKSLSMSSQPSKAKTHDIGYQAKHYYVIHGLDSSSNESIQNDISINKEESNK